MSNFKWKKHYLSYLTYSLLFILSVSIIPVRAAESSSTACAITPSLLSGQGFSVSGQGFSVSGQGFSVSGQGFSVSGQGFSVSGQGFSVSGQRIDIDPLEVAQEIKDHPIEPGAWVSNRLGFFLDRLGFNTNATAILIVDEFNAPDAHGFLVEKVVHDLLNALRAQVPGLKIDSFELDITGVYEADMIRDKIVEKIGQLQGSYHHFILNMSFGLISCDAPPPNSQLPAFHFDTAINTVEANNQSQPSLAVEPELECIVKDNYSSYTAFFGYQNENAQSITLPIGNDKNKFYNSYSINRGQPTFFEPGRQKYVFAVSFSKTETLTWKLKGPDNIWRVATANRYSPQCSAPPTPATLPITPILECVAQTSDTTYEARFGYNNPNGQGANIPVSSSSSYYGGDERIASGSSAKAIAGKSSFYFHHGSIPKDNIFTPDPKDRGQVTTFAPGLHEFVFKVTFNGHDLSWTLNGTTVTANSSTPPCAEPEGYGMGQYLTQNLGVPQEQLASYYKYLADTVENDEFQSLRVLLRGYLSDSADPNQNFSAIAVASSGNLKPWLGDAPLAPASWPETIAVGATVDNEDAPDTHIWQFSQNADFVAPGVGYPLSTNSFAAGTSFAAPAASVLVGMCTTVPNGLKFDGVHPPLTAIAFNASGQSVFGNLMVGQTNLAPLACSPNRKPIFAAPLANRSDPEGTNISFNVGASDPDNDNLTYSATGLPAGIGIGSTGSISGTLGFDTAGTYMVTVTVKDNGIPQGILTGTFTWTVTDVPQVTQVSIDIKPFLDPNWINLQSHGKLTVAILSSHNFDASKVNPRTVTLAGADAIKIHGIPDALLKDVNRDGRRDLILFFRITDLQLTATDTEATLEGMTYSGKSFEGVDDIIIVQPHAPQLLWPPNTANLLTRTFALTWLPVYEELDANTCYLVQIDDSSSFTSPNQSAIVVRTPIYWTFLLRNGLYFWRVAVSDCSSGIISPWSETRSFKVGGH